MPSIENTQGIDSSVYPPTNISSQIELPVSNDIQSPIFITKEMKPYSNINIEANIITQFNPTSNFWNNLLNKNDIGVRESFNQTQGLVNSYDPSENIGEYIPSKPVIENNTIQRKSLDNKLFEFFPNKNAMDQTPSPINNTQFPITQISSLENQNNNIVKSEFISHLGPFDLNENISPKSQIINLKQPISLLDPSLKLNENFSSNIENQNSGESIEAPLDLKGTTKIALTNNIPINYKIQNSYFIPEETMVINESIPMGKLQNSVISTNLNSKEIQNHTQDQFAQYPLIQYPIISVSENIFSPLTKENNKDFIQNIPISNISSSLNQSSKEIYNTSNIPQIQTNIQNINLEKSISPDNITSVLQSPTKINVLSKEDKSQSSYPQNPTSILPLLEIPFKEISTNTISYQKEIQSSLISPSITIPETNSLKGFTTNIIPLEVQNQYFQPSFPSVNPSFKSLPSNNIPSQSLNQNAYNSQPKSTNLTSFILPHPTTTFSTNTIPAQKQSIFTSSAPVINPYISKDNSIQNISSDILSMESKINNIDNLPIISEEIRSNNLRKESISTINSNIFPLSQSFSIDNNIQYSTSKSQIMSNNYFSSNPIQNMDKFKPFNNNTFDINYSQQQLLSVYPNKSNNIQKIWRTQTEIVPVEEIQYIPVKKVKYLKKVKVFVPKIRKIIIPVKKKVIIPVKKTIYIQKSLGVPGNSSNYLPQTPSQYNYLNPIQESNILSDEKNSNDFTYTSTNAFDFSSTSNIIPSSNFMPNNIVSTYLPYNSTTNIMPYHTSTEIDNEIEESAIPLSEKENSPFPISSSLNTLGFSINSNFYNRPNSPIRSSIIYTGKIYSPKTYKPRSLISRK